MTRKNTDTYKRRRVSECTKPHQTKVFQNQSINKYSRIQLKIQFNQNPHKKYILSKFKRLLTIYTSFCNYYQHYHTQFKEVSQENSSPSTETMLHPPEDNKHPVTNIRSHGHCLKLNPLIKLTNTATCFSIS